MRENAHTHNNINKTVLICRCQKMNNEVPSTTLTQNHHNNGGAAANDVLNHGNQILLAV